VNRADVSLKSKEAVVAFDAAQVTVQQMIAAVDRLGFRATLKQRSTPVALGPIGSRWEQLPG